MSEYKMNQYELQSYFKSLCNSFYIAYEQVNRLEKEIEHLEAEEQSYVSVAETLSYWSDNMRSDYEAIESVLFTIKDNEFSVIVTTKAEIYALIYFYTNNYVKNYPVVNMKAEYREVFPCGEEVFDDFIVAYERGLEKKETPDGMDLLYDKYF